MPAIIKAVKVACYVCDKDPDPTTCEECGGKGWIWSAEDVDTRKNILPDYEG